LIFLIIFFPTPQIFAVFSLRKRLRVNVCVRQLPVSPCCGEKVCVRAGLYFNGLVA